MKKRVRFEGWVVLMLVVSQPVLVAQVGVGAGAVGVGGVSLGLQDRVWAVWNDPTQMLDSTDYIRVNQLNNQISRKASYHGVGFLIHQPYQLQSLQEHRLAYVLPYPSKLALGFGFYDSGDERMRHSIIRFAFARAWPMLKVGLATDIQRMGFSRPYSSLFAFSFNLSLQTRISQTLSIHHSIDNLARGHWRSTESRIYKNQSRLQRLPIRLKTSLRHHPANPNTPISYMQFEWEEAYPITLRLAQEWTAWQSTHVHNALRLQLRSGVSLLPLRYYSGIGIFRNQLSVHIALYTHPHLGWSPALDLQFRVPND